MKSVKWVAIGNESSWISSNRLAGYPAKSVPVSGAVHPQLNFSFDLQGLARHERTHLEAFICILCGKPCFSPENLIGKKFRSSLLKAEKFQSSLHKTYGSSFNRFCSNPRSFNRYSSNSRISIVWKKIYIPVVLQHENSSLFSLNLQSNRWILDSGSAIISRLAILFSYPSPHSDAGNFHSSSL